MQVTGCDDGWVAGQHVRLQVFFSDGMFEAHPFTILSAPQTQSCFLSSGMTLAARVNGDWTQALNSYAREEQDRLQSSEKEVDERGVPVHVMIDGPYGGSSIDLGQYETALLIAGGSGATFTLGLLDDIVSRCIKFGRRNEERTRRIEFVWCIKSFGMPHRTMMQSFVDMSPCFAITGHLLWFSSMLSDIANVAAQSTLDLHISIFVTCLCDPDAVPVIQNCDVKLERPSVYSLLCEATTTSRGSSLESAKGNTSSVYGGGVAVCVSGPEGLTRETQNAVARLGVAKAMELGGISVHVENFSL